MTKFFSIVLFAVYSFAIIGININKHYCHGELVDVAINMPTDNCLCAVSANEHDCCPILHTMEESVGCCMVESQFLKVDSDQYFQFLSSEDLLPLLAFAFIVFNDSYLFADNFFSCNSCNLGFYPPPKEPLWLVYSFFTFYG